MKKSKIAVAVFAVIIAAASIVRAEGFDVDFTGKSIGSMSFMEAIKNADSCQNNKIGCEEPKAEAVIERLPLFSQTLDRGKAKSKQPLIKSIVSEYNILVLHDKTVEEVLKTDGVIIAFRLPGEILLTKGGETLSTIKDAALLETIRIALIEHDKEDKQVGGKCLEWVAETVWVYVKGVLVEKAINKCVEYAVEIITHPPPQDPTPHPYPQASGYSSGCYNHPNGQVLCE